MSFSNHTTESVRERADIEEVVGDYVQLKKKGQNLWACCPFHNEKSPSFSVSPSKQIYKCFGCGKAGDAIQFIMDIEGIGFAESIRHLAQKYGIEIEEEKSQTPEQIQALTEKERQYVVLNYAKEHFSLNLDTEEGRSIGLSYFRERGFNRQIIDKFDLGYSIESWDHLLKAAKTAGFTTTELLKAGLILERENQSGNYYDRFRGRVMFTVHNVGGKAIAFGARTLKKDKNQPKYINSPETEVYHKSDTLYGIFQAKQAIKSKDNCYLVEGYTDVLSLHMAGIENVVASSGTSLTESQIKLIKRFTDHVTVLYDGDAAGIKASLRGIDMLLEGGLHVKAVVFPEGEDPDSYAQKVGAEAFTTYLNSEAQDFIKFKIGLSLSEDKSDPIKKAETVRQIVQSISKISDPILQNFYVKEASLLMELEEDLILMELNKALLKSKERDTSSRQVPPTQFPEDLLAVEPMDTKQSGQRQLMSQEREVLRLLINYGVEKIGEELHVCEYLIEETSELQFETPVFKNLFESYREALRRGILPTPEYFLNTTNSELKKELIDMITQKYELSSLWESRHQIFTVKEADNLAKTIYDSVLRLKKRVLKKMLNELLDKIKAAQDGEIADLQQVYMEIKRYQVEIDRQLGTVISH
ncbi:MAG: DNA primase [Lunatimonas sp.]|uniref:DNA primase n=1 Tax=Lunatimonas sp. TaxID=2060141 RepID=UPI00263B039A|nr:DNA primase [Lunatimonas sp.]MCC5936893.1 DNA primase [Lunatimonas sp.]